MIGRFINHIFTSVHDNMESVAATGGGVFLSLLYMIRMHPMDVVGKLGMTFLVGLIGGIGGYTAKYICNKFTKKFKIK